MCGSSGVGRLLKTKRGNTPSSAGVTSTDESTDREEKRMVTKVFNLKTGEFIATYTLKPKNAVKAAYAQFIMRDFNTWNYAKYDDKVVSGNLSVSCGDFAALIK